MLPATAQTQPVVRVTITLGEQRAEIANATDAQIVTMTNMMVKLHEMCGYEVRGLTIVREYL